MNPHAKLSLLTLQTIAAPIGQWVVHVREDLQIAGLDMWWRNPKTGQAEGLP